MDKEHIIDSLMNMLKHVKGSSDEVLLINASKKLKLAVTAVQHDDLQQAKHFIKQAIPNLLMLAKDIDECRKYLRQYITDFVPAANESVAEKLPKALKHIDAEQYRTALAYAIDAYLLSSL